MTPQNNTPGNPRARAWAEVDLGAIRHNVAAVRESLSPSVQIMAVVKADAYGHGLINSAGAAVEGGCGWLGVAAVQEAVDIREAGINCPVALLTPASPCDAGEIVIHRITAMVGDRQFLDAMNNFRHLATSPIPVHLDIETGMGRSGVLPEHAVELWKHAQSLGIEVSGLSTHYADADGEDPLQTRLQQREFERARSLLVNAGARFQWTHLDNSASTLDYHDVDCNLVRVGLLVYGIVPKAGVSTEETSIARSKRDSVPILRAALELKARVAAIRSLPMGSTISYGAVHRLRRNSRVATVLIGYGDGYPRALSDKGRMLICGKYAPILGRICMDQTVIDVTDIPEAAVGDEVVCIGKQGSASIAVNEISTLIFTTVHEITTCLTSRLPRVYLNSLP